MKYRFLCVIAVFIMLISIVPHAAYAAPSMAQTYGPTQIYDGDYNSYATITNSNYNFAIFKLSGVDIQNQVQTLWVKLSTAYSGNYIQITEVDNKGSAVNTHVIIQSSGWVVYNLHFPSTISEIRVGTVSYVPLNVYEISISPPTVHGLKVTGITTNSVSISWDQDAFFQKYRVYMNDVMIAETSGVTYTIDGLNTGTTYTIAVSGVSAGWESPKTTMEATTLPPPPPPAPTGVSATATSSTSVSVSWQPVSGAQQYDVYRDGSKISTVIGTTYSDTGLTPHTTHTYKVSAVDAYGQEGPQSAAVTVITPYPPPPSAPSGMRVTGSTQTSVSLAWDAVPGAAYYSMLRDGVLEDPEITGTTYTITGLEPGHMYQISLAATDAYGQTGPATVITVSTQTPPPPGAPTGLHVTGVTTSSVSLSWSPQAGSVQYGVYRDGQHVAAVTDTQYTDQGLPSGTQYRYTITSIDGWNQEGPQSAAVTASTETPPPPPPAAPTGLRVTGSTQTSITVAWNTVSGTQTYTVYLDGVLYQAGVQGTTFMVGGLQAGTSHTIAVSGTDAWGQEGAQSSVKAQTQLPDLLGAPGGLQATNATATTVSLAWAPVHGAQQYAVYRDGLRVGTSSGTSYTDSDLGPSTTHTYTVSAIDAWGREGEKSPGVQVTTLAVDLKPPTVQKAGCTLTWAPAPGTPNGVEYIVYQNGFEVARTTQTSYSIPNCGDLSQYTVAVYYQGVVSTPSVPAGGIGIDARATYGFTPSDVLTNSLNVIWSIGSLLLLVLAVLLAPRIRDMLRSMYEKRRRERWWERW